MHLSRTQLAVRLIWVNSTKDEETLPISKDVGLCDLQRGQEADSSSRGQGVRRWGRLPRTSGLSSSSSRNGVPDYKGASTRREGDRNQVEARPGWLVPHPQVRPVNRRGADHRLSRDEEEFRRALINTRFELFALHSARVEDGVEQGCTAASNNGSFEVLPSNKTSIRVFEELDMKTSMP